jgi:signal peptidase I
VARARHGLPIGLVRVSGGSMAPTLRSSDLLVTRPVGRAGLRVGRGDVVVLRHGGVRMVKRVVALPGDVVELEAGRLFVDGASVDGRPRVRGAAVATWRVPAATCFVAGDDAAVSDDSRVWDEPFVRAEDVDGVVVGRLGLHPRRSLRRRRPAPAGGRAA